MIPDLESKLYQVIKGFLLGIIHGCTGVLIILTAMLLVERACEIDTLDGKDIFTFYVVILVVLTYWAYKYVMYQHNKQDKVSGDE